MEFVNKATGLRCKFLRGKWKWMFAVFGRLHKFSGDFYYLDIWQCARYFVAALFKELALITIRETWGLESQSRSRTSRSRLLWQSLGLGVVSKFEPGFGLGGYGLDYITGLQYLAVCTNFGWFLLSWYLAMCQIFCCSIIPGVSFNCHQRNVRSRSRTSRSRSQLLWQSLGLISKFEPDLVLGGYGLDYITG